MKMAAELKLNDSNNSLQKITKKENILSLNKDKNVEYYTFNAPDIVIYTISFFIFIATVITDILVITQCYLNNYTSMMYIVLGFLIIPNIITQIISIRLYNNRTINNSLLIIHVLCFGTLYRYFILLEAAVRSIRDGIFMRTKESVLQLQNEAFTVSLFASFLMGIPQLVIQIYIWTVSNISPWISTSVIISFSFITWTIITNSKYTLQDMPQKHLPSKSALIVESLWRSGFLISRIAALVLCALCTKSWFFVLIGLHWLGMTIWLSIHKTHFWIENWQECARSCLMGIINCFDYVQYQNSDRSWFKTWTYYIIMLVENIVLLLTYILYFKDIYKLDDLIMYSTTIAGGAALGLINMILYNSIFKSTNETSLCIFMDFKTPTDNIIENNVSKIIKGSFSSSRQLKNLSETIAIPDDITADKKSLLNNIVQNTDTIEKGIANRSFTIADEVEKTECKVISENEESSSFSSLQRQKRRGICPSLEVDLETDEVKLEDLDINLSSHKRRGICSLMQLCEENADINLEKRNDRLLIDNSILQSNNGQTTISECVQSKNELKLQILGESDEKSVGTRSHVSSIHDYENLCPLGIARPPWCIRSWKGYTDIETYIHDDSIVRDRRRDTLTSTATATTLSSEYSDATYTSFPFKRFLRRSRQDDYLDTLTYDLVDFETNLNNNERSSHLTREESEPTLFMAKPVVIDDRGGMLSLDTILEEHEDTSPKKPTNSLVATIDKIRTEVAENSPRHIYYHRNESQWEDIECRVSVKRTSLATVLFDNQYQEMSLMSKYSSPWRYSRSFNNELDIIKEIYSHDKQTIPLIDAVLSDSPILGSRTDIKEVSIKEAENIVDFSNLKEDNVYVDMSGGKKKNPDNIYETLEALIAQTEKIPISLEANDSCDLSTPLESRSNLSSLTLKKEFKIQKIINTNVNEKENQDYNSYSPCEKLFSVEKQQIITARPRRKFSLLRERFEPKSEFPTHPTNHWSKTVPNEGGISIILSEQDMFDSAIAKEKEIVTKIGHVDKSLETNYRADNRSTIDIKDKRSIFLKQILSSPKFHGWSKKRTFSPNAKIAQNY